MPAQKHHAILKSLLLTTATRLDMSDLNQKMTALEPFHYKDVGDFRV
jgi:hypothetical protein